MIRFVLIAPLLAACEGSPPPATKPTPPPPTTTPKLSPTATKPVVTRLEGNPILTPQSDPSVGDNLNGPSLIRAPDWLPNKLGTYYLYFADHRGSFIRLAYANKLEGPWTVYKPGTLKLDQTRCVRHLASPDVHVDDAKHQIRMYFHCPTVKDQPGQSSLLALSSDGISFTANTELLGRAYFRVFPFQDHVYAVSEGGQIYRSADGLTAFEEGPELFPHAVKEEAVRHVAVRVVGNTLEIYYSRKGDAPERILRSTVTLEGDWKNWRASEPTEILQTEQVWEGSDLPIKPSEKSDAKTRLHELRDPGIFEESGKTYLLYSIAGESGIGIAELR